MSLTAEVRAPLRSFDLEVELEVAPQGSLAFVGPSGAGKSTILRIVAGLMRPAAGRVTVDGEVWLETAAGVDLPAEARRCGMLFQGYALFPHMTAADNVAYPLAGLPRRERAARARALLERVGIGELAGVRPGELSGGERQRVAIARALARSPRALLLDEPLSALDPHSKAEVIGELRRTVRAARVPTLVVTHDFWEAAALADRVAVIESGHLIQAGTAAEIAARPANGFVASLSGATTLAGTARPGTRGLTAVELDDGSVVFSPDEARGSVSASVYPWEIELASPGAEHRGSAINALDGTIASLWSVGGRVRVAVDAAQPLVAEVTQASVERLGLQVGSPVRATWKAVATRLLPRR